MALRSILRGLEKWFMSLRGTIRNRQYAARIQDFSGLQFDRMTPTNIDAFLDFAGRLFVFVEAKYQGAPLSTGQRIAYEHLANAIVKGGGQCTVLIGSYETDHDIDFARCKVTKYFYRGKWHTPQRVILVRAAIDELVRRSRK